MRRRLALLLLLVLALSGCGQPVVFSGKPVRGEVIAVGNEVGGPQELLVYMDSLRQQYADVYGEAMLGQAGTDVERAVRESALERLARVKLFVSVAGEKEEAPGEEETERARVRAEQYLQVTAERGLEEKLEDEGITEELLVRMFLEYEIAENEAEHLLDHYRTEVSEDEARTVEIMSIVLAGAQGDASVHERAQAILDEIRDGMENLRGIPFDTYVARYSEGETGLIRIGRDNPDTALVEAAFGTAEGKISEVVDCLDGCRIIKVISANDENRTRENQKQMEKERQEEAFEQAYAELLEGTEVLTDEEVLSQVFAKELPGFADFFAVAGE